MEQNVFTDIQWNIINSNAKGGSRNDANKSAHQFDYADIIEAIYAQKVETKKKELILVFELTYDMKCDLATDIDDYKF